MFEAWGEGVEESLLQELMSVLCEHDFFDHGSLYLALSRRFWNVVRSNGATGFGSSASFSCRKPVRGAEFLFHIGIHASAIGVLVRLVWSEMDGTVLDWSYIYQESSKRSPMASAGIE